VQSLFPASPNELSDSDLAQLYAYPLEQRWVRANFVSTLDGAVQGPDARSGSLSSPADHHLFALLRSLCDVVLIGANTTRVEGYQPVTEDEMNTAVRADLGLAPVPSIAVVSRSLHLDPALLRGGAAPTVVITTAAAPADLRAEVEALATVIVAGEHSVDVSAALDALAAMGLQRVLCEGGPSLMRDLVASGELDELCLTLTPRILAGDALRLTHGAAVAPPAELRLRHLLENDGELFCRYDRN